MNSDQILEELSTLENTILTCERNHINQFWTWKFHHFLNGITLIIEKDGETSLQALLQIKEAIERIGQFGVEMEGTQK